MTDRKVTPEQVEIVRETVATVEQAHPPGRLWPFFVTAVAVASLAALIIWNQLQSAPVTRLPPAERYKVYVQTLDHFGRICEAEQLGPEVLAVCSAEADLLRRLPDCDGACQDRTSSYAHAHSSR